jgi:hypothetical protein
MAISSASGLASSSSLASGSTGIQIGTMPPQVSDQVGYVRSVLRARRRPGAPRAL